MIAAILFLAQTQPTTAPVPPDPLFVFYATNLRGSFFSGFLTLGSFLVAVNTFIVVNLKKELYDNAGYRKRVADRRALNTANKSKKIVTFFGPLRRLSALLFWSILLSLMTAVAQLTIGVYPSRISAIICICMAGATIIVLICVLFTIKANLKEWFAFLEEEAGKK